MNVGLAVEMDSELEPLSDAIARIDGNLKQFFAAKDYSDDVSNVFIGLILMGPDAERLHPFRPVKYTRVSRFTSRITGKRVELKNVLEFDVKPDYGKLRTLNIAAAEKYIVESLVEGVDQLRQCEERFPRFDVLRFKDDLRVCLFSKS